MSLRMDNFTTIRSKRWEKKCEAWAAAKRPFEIRSLQTEHFDFLQKICSKYKYSYQFQVRGGEFVAVLTPAR
jgi:hypothetical protein